MQTINAYSSASGYKLNIQKCEAMVLGAPICKVLKEKYPWQWDKDRVKYLGTVIPKNINLLYPLNYKSLEVQIRQDLNRWRTVILTLGRRIDAIRMNILLRFLFLFQTIPIYISSNDFNNWDKMMSKFLWEEKKPRVKMKTLKLAKERGGLALPNLKHYYYAAQLQPIRVWLNDNSQAKWRSIEKHMCHVSLKTIPFCTVIPRKTQVTENIFSRNTLEIWLRIKKQCQIKDDLIVLREIKEDPELTPSKQDTLFSIWGQRGLTIFGQCLDDNGVMSFETLRKYFDLPHSHHFYYLQLRSYIHASKIGRKSKSELHPLVQFLLRNYNKIRVPHQITTVYSILENSYKQQDTRAKLKWEEELNIHITEETWKQMNRNVHTTTASPYWREYAWKIQSRYFITPVQQVKYNHKVSSNCWRECGESHAKFSHIFWFCPSLKTFWNNIQNEMNIILRVVVNLNADVVLLGKNVNNVRGDNDRYLLRVLRVTALKQITRNWLQKTCPVIDKWRDTVQQISIMEHLTYKLRGNLKLFDTRWSKWLTYYKMVKNL